MKTKTFYYTKLKNGDIRLHERQPKNKPFIKEEYIPCQNFQETMHVLDNGKISREVICRCGFDRQVKLINKIKSMF